MPICFFSSKTMCIVIFWQETACVSKAREWPRGWQMPSPRAVQNLQIPRSSPGAGGGGLGAGGIDWCIKTEALKLYNFHLLLFIFLFNYLPLKNFAVCRIQEFLQFCCSFSITRTRNTAEYRLNEVYCILFSVVRLRLCYNFHAEKGGLSKIWKSCPLF